MSNAREWAQFPWYFIDITSRWNVWNCIFRTLIFRPVMSERANKMHFSIKSNSIVSKYADLLNDCARSTCYHQSIICWQPKIKSIIGFSFRLSIFNAWRIEIKQTNFSQTMFARRFAINGQPLSLICQDSVTLYKQKIARSWGIIASGVLNVIKYVHIFFHIKTLHHGFTSGNFQDQA